MNILSNILTSDWADLIDRKLYNERCEHYSDHTSINLLDLCEINDIEKSLHDKIYNLIMAEIFNDPAPDPEFDPFKPVGVDLSDLE